MGKLNQKTKSKKVIGKKPKVRRLKPQEFLEVMARVKMIDEEMAAETKLYDVKVKSLELEKEYLMNRVNPAKK